MVDKVTIDEVTPIDKVVDIIHNEHSSSEKHLDQCLFKLPGSYRVLNTASNIHIIQTNGASLKLEQIEFENSVCVGVWCMCVGDMCMHHGTCVVTRGQLCRVGSFLSPSRGLRTSQQVLPTEPSPWPVVSRFLVFGCTPQGISTGCFHGGGGTPFHSICPLFLPLSPPGKDRTTFISLFPRLASPGHHLPS